MLITFYHFFFMNYDVCSHHSLCSMYFACFCFDLFFLPSKSVCFILIEFRYEHFYCSYYVIYQLFQLLYKIKIDLWNSRRTWNLFGFFGFKSSNWVHHFLNSARESRISFWVRPVWICLCNSYWKRSKSIRNENET